MSYSEEEERGSFIAIAINLQAAGCAVGDLIALLINRNSRDAAGVPVAVYIIIIAMMGCGCLLALTLRPASRVIREDGTQVATLQARGYWEELKANLDIFKDWKLLIMVPAFLPSECFLVYTGSVNAYHNNLRTRTLLSFCAVTLQIPAGYALQKILDHKAWTRRTRAFLGLAAVSVPMLAAWIWEIVRTRHYNRLSPPSPMDWSDGNFAATFVLFCLNWISSILMQCIILYFLSCMTNSPTKAANYAVSPPPFSNFPSLLSFVSRSPFIGCLPRISSSWRSNLLWARLHCSAIHQGGRCSLCLLRHWRAGLSLSRHLSYQRNRVPGWRRRRSGSGARC
jgi:hypothetical protein